MCAEAGTGRAVHSPDTFSGTCPAFLFAVPDEFFDESDHFFKKTAAQQKRFAEPLSAPYRSLR